jgi:cell division protein FtsB
MYDRHNSRPRQFLVSLCCLSALGYFAFHAVNGRRGLEARLRLIERLQIVEPQLARLETARSRLERDVRLLDQGDKDMIEELAVETLGFAYPGDTVLAPPR